jgi:large subunit ribosomal protein L15
MQFHNLKKNRANRKAKQVGRGGTRGKTSGRGTKGQNARSGRKKRPEMRDVIKRLPKLRGRGKNFLKSRVEKPIAINISRVKSHFKEGEEITAKALLEKGLIKTRSGRLPKIKVLNG